MPLLSRFPRTLVIMCLFRLPLSFSASGLIFYKLVSCLHSNARLPAHPVTVFTEVFTENCLWFHKLSTQPNVCALCHNTVSYPQDVLPSLPSWPSLYPAFISYQHPSKNPEHLHSPLMCISWTSCGYLKHSIYYHDRVKAVLFGLCSDNAWRGSDIELGAAGHIVHSLN